MRFKSQSKEINRDEGGTTEGHVPWSDSDGEKYGYGNESDDKNDSEVK